MVEVRAHSKYVRMSPRKLRFLLADVRKNSPQRALDRLALTQQRGAKILHKVISAAISNAKQKAIEGDLEFKTIQVDEGSNLRRFRAGSKGTGKPYIRRSSHITVILQVKEPKKPVIVENAKENTQNSKQEEKKAEVKKEVKKTTPKTEKTKGVKAKVAKKK